jgi:hypothetical protein
VLIEASKNGDSQDDFAVIFLAMQEEAIRLLSMENANKDVVTSAGMIYILSFYYEALVSAAKNAGEISSDVIIVEKRLLPFLQCVIQLSNASNSVAATTESDSSIQNIPNFPEVISRCSLIRAVINSYDLSLYSENILFQYEILDYLILLSSSGNSGNQLYALQTLENWISISLTILQKNLTKAGSSTATTAIITASTASATAPQEIQIFQSFLQSIPKIMKILKHCWSHSSRQVSPFLLFFLSPSMKAALI